MLNSFKPVIDDRSVLLILGSLPGPRSLERQEYYGHPQNQFWRILFSVFQETPMTQYQVKCEFLLSHRIALWDVIRSAEREGALDQNIINETPNDFHKLFSQYPNIQYLIFNGAKAEHSFRRHFPLYYKEMNWCRMPSTSPVPSRNPLSISEKTEIWAKSIQYGLSFLGNFT